MATDLRRGDIPRAGSIERRGNVKRPIPIVMRPALFLLLLATLEGCNSGGGSPTSPSGPAATAAGTYSGFATFFSAQPPGHCFAGDLAALGGHAFAYTLELTQVGDRVSGVLDGTDFRQRCDVEGTFAAGSLSLDQTSCTPRCFEIQLSTGPCAIVACAERAHLQGLLSPAVGELKGDLQVEWSTTATGSGNDLGNVTIDADITLRR
jgi:hypothetical protein